MWLVSGAGKPAFKRICFEDNAVVWFDSHKQSAAAEIGPLLSGEDEQTSIYP